MSELTQIDGSYQNVAANGDTNDWDAEANRWTKGDNDRLYIDGTKFVDYVALDSLVAITKGSGVSATAEIEGDELTLEITRDDGINHKEMSATFALPDDLAEETDEEADEDGSQAKLVTDGGEVVASELSDEEITDAIDSQGGGGDHPDAVTVEEVRDTLSFIERSATEVWGTWMDNIEHNETEVVAETSSVIVVSTGEWNVVGDELEAMEFEGELEREGPARDILASIITNCMHKIARKHCDRNWSVDYPWVLPRPGHDGQDYVEATINSLLKRGLSPGQAWAFYGVEIRGNSRNLWSSRCGYADHSTVSEALRKAKRKLP